MSAVIDIQPIIVPIGRRRRRHDGIVSYVVLSPSLLGALILTVGPLATSLYLSFTQFDLLETPRWVGLSNYSQMLDDGRFWDAMRVSLTYVALSVPLKLLAALGLAMILNQGMRVLNLYRAVMYLPSLLGSSVAVALLWHRMFDSDGLVNHLLGRFGIQGASWISDPRYALGTLVLLSIWQFGPPMIVFLAGLRQIPGDLYDAASVDGAKAWRQFRRITIPMLTPVIFFNPYLSDDRGAEGIHPGLRRQWRNWRPHRLHALLYALSISRGVCQFPHGVRLGPSLGSYGDDRRPDRHSVHRLAILGPL
jgi:ABC-type sugar transport system permease subunit